MGQAAPCRVDCREGLGLSRLVLVPGLLCDESIWSRQVEALSKTIEVVVPTFRSATSLEEMAHISLDACDGPISIAGLSMGARVALEMWRAEPERIRRLALLDFWVGPPAEGEPARRQVLTDMSRDEGIEAVAVAWVDGMVHPDRRDDSELLPGLHAMVSTYTPEQHAGQIDALLNRADLWPLLPTISVPTLVAVGRQDPWRTVEQHRQMADAIPGSRLEVIEDCGHLSPAEQPQVVTELLADWLKWE